MEMPKLEGVVFDLDGVVTDTAKFHYLAWKQMAESEGIDFDEKINERLKGVSRMDSLKIIMEKRKREYSEAELLALAKKKNDLYVTMLDKITSADILPGITAFINELRTHGIKTVIFSASKNTDTILQKLGMSKTFDALVTGNDVEKTKPHPEGFLLAAKKIEIAPENCVMIEDAFAGVEGAKAVGMKTMGIGQKLQLHNADYVLVSTQYLTYEKVKALF
jgi:beta-phosphoglucomutase